MFFLKKLFDSTQPAPPNLVESNPKRTISDFFKVDFSKIPDETFFQGPNEVNSTGSPLENYQKQLDYFEFGLFNVIEIKKFNDSSKNLFFKNYDLPTVNLNLVKQLIDDLYLINGPDDNHQGTFNSKDRELFYSTDFDVLFGRRWSDPKKHKYPLAVAIDRSTNVISLTIWGA